MNHIAFVSFFITETDFIKKNKIYKMLLRLLLINVFVCDRKYVTNVATGTVQEVSLVGNNR